MPAIVKPNVTFSLDLLRCFVAVVDAKGFTAAARKLNSTQSTVSQKLMRLEDAAGVRLIDRSRAEIRLTEAGERLLFYARRILALNEEASAALVGAARDVPFRLGLPEDFASGSVTPALAAFIRRHPEARLEVTSGLSRDLRRAFGRGELDLVLVKQSRADPRGALHWPEPLGWFQGVGSDLAETDPLPLVAFPANGLYRQDMIDALERAGRGWRLVYTSSSLAGLVSAIRAGLGISLLPRRVVDAGCEPIATLPEVPAMEIAIHHSDPGLPFAQEIIAILTAAVEAQQAR